MGSALRKALIAHNVKTPIAWYFQMRATQTSPSTPQLTDSRKAKGDSERGTWSDIVMDTDLINELSSTDTDQLLLFPFCQ